MRLSNDFTLRSIQYAAVKCKRNREFYHNDSDVSFYDRLCQEHVGRDFTCVDCEAYTVDWKSRCPILNT